MQTSYDPHQLGFPEMDSQHAYCYTLFNKIEHTAATGDHQKMGKLLHEIEHYLMFHFTSEEHLMRMYDTPGFSVHQSDHEQFEQKLVQFLDDFDAGTLNPVAMRIFLTGWLLEHSSLSDSEYVKWISTCREKL
jgi:hemerythrin-like metal-binding protein